MGVALGFQNIIHQNVGHSIIGWNMHYNLFAHSFLKPFTTKIENSFHGSFAFTRVHSVAVSYLFILCLRYRYIVKVQCRYSCNQFVAVLVRNTVLNL